MKTRKRLSALVLALCLVLSMTVPAVWAEEETEVLTYSFYSADAKFDITHSSVGEAQNWGAAYTQMAPNGPVAFNDNVWYLNQSASNVGEYTDAALSYPNRIWTEKNYIAAAFYGEKDVEAGHWISLQINNVKAGTYDMTFTTGLAKLGGLFQVYVLDSAKYAEVIQTYDLNDSSVLTKEQNDAIYKALAEKNAILNDVEKSALDCSDQAAQQDQSIGSVTFANDGSYVLLFRIVGRNEAAQTNAYRLTLRTLTMTAVAAEEKPAPEQPAEVYDYLVYSADAKFDITHSSVGEANNWGAAYTQMSPNSPVAINDNVWYLNQSASNAREYSDPSIAYPNRTWTEKNYAAVSFYGETDVADGQWIAFQINNVKAGTYNMTFTTGSAAMGGLVKVYVLDSAKYSEVIDDYNLNDSTVLTKEQNDAIYNALSEKKAILNDLDRAVLDCSDQAAQQDQSIGNVTFENSGSYVLLFRIVGRNAATKATAYRLVIRSLTMTSANPGDVPEQPPVNPGGSTINPDGPVNAPVALIGSELAAKNAIGSFTTRVLATAEVNGHQYVYVAMMGAMMYVYDLDAGKLVDAMDDVFTTPRSIHVDKDGIVWVSGAQGFLYRYDPYTKTGKQIEMSDWKNLFPNITSLNLWGLTSDDNGNIYFATYNTSYVGMYNSKTGEYSRISEHLDPDAIYAGTGGVILKDGYAYLTIDGDKNNDGTTLHELIKFDLESQQIVERLDLAAVLGSQSYLTNMKLVDGVIFGSHDKALNGTVAVDITGEEMKLIEIPGLTGIKNAVSEEIDGKVYFLDLNKQFQVYDIASRTVTPLGIGGSGSDVPLKASTGGVVTIEGDERLPGKSLVTYKTTTTSLNLIVYNPQTKATVTIEDITEGQGSGNKLTHITASPDGKTLYVGAYGNNNVSIYDVESGKIIEQFETYSHQSEGFVCYNGYLYAGHYGACGIAQIDLETLVTTPLFTLETSVFSQHRMGTLTAGDGKVFAATGPTKGRLGGVLTWYDIEENRIYVAGGPNPEDVYYTQAGNLTGTGWYSAVTNEPADFDDDNDGKEDNMITVDGKSVQRFNGVIEKQTINCLIYQNGYIIGSTDRAGGSGSVNIGVGNACLFVYDVEAMKLVAELDISKAIEGLPTPVQFIDVIAADPDVEGKFWGIVSDTLFSFTFDFETGKFTVTEEISFGKKNYDAGASNWHGRDIAFDGDFMYVVFPSSGTYMIERANIKNYYKLSDETPRHMVLAADNNLYFLENISNDIRVLPIAQTTQTIKDPYEAADVQALIDALDDAANITLEDEAAVTAARAAYEKLSEAGKALVKAEKLTAAEAAIAALQNPKTGEMVSAAVFAGILIASAAALSVVLLSDIRRKLI